MSCCIGIKDFRYLCRGFDGVPDYLFPATVYLS